MQKKLFLLGKTTRVLGCAQPDYCQLFLFPQLNTNLARVFIPKFLPKFCQINRIPVIGQPYGEISNIDEEFKIFTNTIVEKLEER